MMSGLGLCALCFDVFRRTWPRLRNRSNDDVANVSKEEVAASVLSVLIGKNALILG
jgi:hypothetical protein